MRRDGRQKVTVEHVHVHAGGQATVGNVTANPTQGAGDFHKAMDNPMQQRTAEPLRLRQAKRCLSKTRSGKPCHSPAANGTRRCRMHGRALGSGAPRGERNGNYRDGFYTASAMADRQTIRELSRSLSRAVTG